MKTLFLFHNNCAHQNLFQDQDIMKIKLIRLAATLALILFGISQQTVNATETPRVLLKTNMGEIVLVLNPEKAPVSTANFLQYVRDGHYSGTLFHRVINNFMIQGGGFDTNMKPKPTRASIQNEADNGLKNKLYTVAMARTSAPHSAKAQFFINVNDNVFLDYPGRDGWGYAVFGKVSEGTDVVDKIKQVSTEWQDKPTQPVVIESARIIK